MNIRIGHGDDVHRFDGEQSTTDDRFVVLGGIKIPHTQSLLAHSDGDVLIHALCDALLGALGEGDIGKHFPDTDPQLKGIDSRILLRDVFKQVQAKGYQLGNADMTIIAQAPKITPYVTEMISILAEDMQTASANINVKASTTEEMGFTGRREGIAAMAVVLLQQK